MKIKKVKGREILDSRGLPTLECEIFLDKDLSVRASVPSGLSTGKYEALELRDGDDKRFFGKGEICAVKNLEEKIAPLLIGKKPDFYALDEEIINLDGTENKSNLGANTTLVAGIAVARAQALAEDRKLFEVIADSLGYEKKHLSIPLSMFNILNGGAHGNNRLDIQEFMIMPKKESSFLKYLEKAVEVYRNLRTLLSKAGLSINVGDEGGFAPVLVGGKKTPEETALDFLVEAIDISGLRDDVVICLDVAASQFYDQESGLYKFQDRQLKYSEMTEFYEKIVETYPIYSIEDGLDEEDWEGWQFLTKKIGEKVQLVGDDLFVTNLKRINKGVNLETCNAVLIKPNQIGSITQTLESIKYCHEIGYQTVISHRSGETCDTFIADLVVGSKGGQLKAGAPARGERVAKYNQLLRIEELL